jgi:hypothetical protein
VSGHRALIIELQVLVATFRERWTDIAGRTAIQAEELDEVYRVSPPHPRIPPTKQTKVPTESSIAWNGSARTISSRSARSNVT